jgi:hypothetical protein
LIQIGFNSNLNYKFVATTPLSSSQIFLYLPLGLEYALREQAKDVSMLALRPYDNSEHTGYVATVALAYIPANEKETLAAMLHNPNSRLYEQPNDSVQALMSMIDPSIPLEVGGSSLDSGGSGKATGGDVGGDNGGGGNKSNDSQNAGAGSSSPTTPSSVGIGVGVVAGAAAYGAGMFWLARRYRRKRQSHQRSSSNVEQMSEGPQSGSLLGGRASPYSDHSGSNRTQMISAPVMAENSLGWN